MIRDCSAIRQGQVGPYFLHSKFYKGGNDAHGVIQKPRDSTRGRGSHQKRNLFFGFFSDTVREVYARLQNEEKRVEEIPSGEIIPGRRGRHG